MTNLEDEMKEQIKKIHKDINNVKTPTEEDKERKKDREIRRGFTVILAFAFCPLLILTLLVWVSTLR